MRRVILLLIFLQCSVFIYSQIIADHTVVDKFDKIPQQYIDEVKKMLIDIAGESHSSGYRNGLNLLEILDPRFQVITYDGSIPAYSTQNLRLGRHTAVGEAAFYTTQAAINTYKAHITSQNNTGNSYSVVGFGWCWDMHGSNPPGGTKDPVHNVRWAGASEGGPNGNMRWGLDAGDQALTGNSVCMDTYLSAVEQYIQHCVNNSYPTKVIFTTGPVDNVLENTAGTETGFQRELKHDYIRSYVAANNTRILFDYADILCWNNSGVEYVTNWNDGGTNRPHANIHPDNMMDYDASWNLIPQTEDGDHIGEVGTVRLAKAMWWMLARIAGWDGDIYSGYVWQGSISSNFGNLANWIDGVVPPDGANISFGANPVNHCLLDKNRSLKNITNSQGMDMLVVNGHQLTITGNLILYGGAQIDATANGSGVVFAGSVAQNLPSGSFINNTVSSLIVANPAGLSFNGDLTVPQVLTISIGSRLSIGPANRLTVSGTVNNNGILNLYSDATGIFSLMMNNYSGTGTANINMYLTGGAGGAQGTDFKWHYVAVPTYLSDKSVFTSINSENLLRYSDSRIHDGESSYNGWQWHDGYNEVTQVINSSDAFFDLEVGRGYNFYHSSTSAVAIFSNLLSLQASLGNILLQYSGDGKTTPSNYGLNLLGNSLTCGIDWNLVTEETGDPDDAIYYTIDNKLAIYVRGAPGGINGATKDIPPLQGFFVKSSATGTSLNFSAAKEHTNQVRYKKGSVSADAMIKLELNKTGNQDETLIWFNEKATNSFDGSYDAVKLFSSETGYDQIYTCFGSEKFGINGMPFPEKSIIIPVSLKLLNSGSDYKIIASQLQRLDNYKVTLTDKLNSNFTIDLKITSSYSFSSGAGTFPDRFFLTITNISAGVPEIPEQEKAFNIFVFNRILNTELLNNALEGKKGTISVYDLTGKKVLRLDNIGLYFGYLKQIPLNISDGIYIVELKSEKQKFVSKILLY